MADETKVSSLTEIVNSEWIDSLIQAYAMDDLVIAPLCRFASLQGRGTTTASFPAQEKDTASDLTEGNDLSNVEFQTTEATTVSTAMVGILREVTEFAKQANILGREGLMQMIVEDGARLCNEMLEDDLAALFSSATNSVGESGTDFSIANFVQAMAKLDTQKARGRKVCVLDDQAMLDLTTAVAASTGTVFANAASGAQSILNARTGGFRGTLFGVDVYMTNLTDTANTGADVVSCMFIDGNQSPRYAPFAIAQLWAPSVKEQPLAASVADAVSISAAQGVGLISQFNCVKIVTDA